MSSFFKPTHQLKEEICNAQSKSSNEPLAGGRLDTLQAGGLTIPQPVKRLFPQPVMSLYPNP